MVNFPCTTFTSCVCGGVWSCRVWFGAWRGWCSMLKYGACDITIGVINGQIEITLQISTVNGQWPTAKRQRSQAACGVVRCGVVCGGVWRWGGVWRCFLLKYGACD